MNWYHVENGQQRGPITEAQLDELARAGTIKADTLVWADGMANWQPYSQARPQTQGAAVEGGVLCSVCGGNFRPDAVVRFDNRFVCAACKPVFLQQLQEGALPSAGSGPGNLEYAGFWIRFGAKFIDWIVIAIPIYALNFGLAFLMFGVLMPQYQPGGDLGKFLLYQGIVMVTNTAIGMMYSGFFLARYSATPGKMACGLTVVRPDGAGLTFWRGALRSLGEFLSSIICLIGFIIAAFDEEKRALHDRICDTRVVKKK
jgi:uncharacterized RDD family membrane protein YckC